MQVGTRKKKERKKEKKKRDASGNIGQLLASLF